MKEIGDLLSKFSGFMVEMRVSLAKASALTLDCGWLKGNHHHHHHHHQTLEETYEGGLLYCKQPWV
ncbi:unnamed protein product [Musa acuminata subsp. burmannicoides]